jgi:uncharacterized phosphosugar-binding protein
MATLTLPMSAALGALGRASTGDELLAVLDVLVDNDSADSDVADTATLEDSEV